MSCRNERKHKNVTYHDTSGYSHQKSLQPSVFAAIRTADEILSKDKINQQHQLYDSCYNHNDNFNIHYLSFFEKYNQIKSVDNNSLSKTENQIIIDRDTLSAVLLFLKPRKVFDKGNWKEEKICLGCCRPFTWRKKWERCWETIYCCSEKCKGVMKKGVQQSGKQVEVEEVSSVNLTNVQEVQESQQREDTEVDNDINSNCNLNHGNNSSTELQQIESTKITSHDMKSDSVSNDYNDSETPVESDSKKVKTQPGTKGDQYPYITGNIWNHCYRGDIKTVKKLLLQIPPALRNKVGWTPLHAAAAGGSERVIEFLLDLKFKQQNSIETLQSYDTQSYPPNSSSININASDSSGRSPLFEAVRNGHLGCCKLLIKKGKADIFHEDKKKLTVFNHIYCKDKGIREYLNNQIQNQMATGPGSAKKTKKGGRNKCEFDPNERV